MCDLNRKITGLQDEVSIVKMSGKMKIRNLVDRLVSEVSVVEQDEQMIGNLFSIFGSKKEQKPVKPNNEVKVEIYKRIGVEKILFAKGHGNFARYLEIGNLIYYEHSKVDFSPWVHEEKGEFTLPSSSVMRKELDLIREEKIEEAEKSYNKGIQEIV